MSISKKYLRNLSLMNDILQGTFPRKHRQSSTNLIFMKGHLTGELPQTPRKQNLKNASPQKRPLLSRRPQLGLACRLAVLNKPSHTITIV